MLCSSLNMDERLAKLVSLWYLEIGEKPQQNLYSPFLAEILDIIFR